MNKSTLKTIVDKYKDAERQVDQLDELGVCIGTLRKRISTISTTILFLSCLMRYMVPRKEVW